MDRVSFYGPSRQFNLDEAFTYHPPFGDQASRYEQIRNAGKEFARTVEALCPNSAERMLAVRKIQEGVMWANAGIAINEKPEFSDVDTTPTKGDG